MTEMAPHSSALRKFRMLLWLLVPVAVLGAAALILSRNTPSGADVAQGMQAAPGAPFVLEGADGKPFSSARLSGKPYAIYFGFTRCGDICPTTLARLARLRDKVTGTGKLNIVFVTIDPAHDGPKEVGQYAGLFNSPIIGLTGSQAQIDRVKKQYGIFAQPSSHPMAGKEIEHSAVVLLFDRNGKFVTTIAPDDPDNDALSKLKALTA